MSGIKLKSICLPDLRLTAMPNRLTLSLGSVPTERQVRRGLAVSPSDKLSPCPPPCSPRLSSLKNPQNLQIQRASLVTLQHPMHLQTPGWSETCTHVLKMICGFWSSHTPIFISISHTTTTKTCTVSERVFNRKCSQVSKRKVHTAPTKVMSNTLWKQNITTINTQGS